MRHLEIPGYVDPAVLEPGAQVECVLDGSHSVLTVLRVEPALICAAPDGTELVILAHTAVPSETTPANATDLPYDTCRTCGHPGYNHRSTYTDDQGMGRGWSCVMHGCTCETFRGGRVPETGQ